MKMIFLLLTFMTNSFAAQKLFITPASNLGTYLPLPNATTWTQAGTLDFTVVNPAQVMFSLNMDAKLDTCTGGCPTPNKGGSMMVDLRVTNTATNELVLSRRLNGGMAILSGGTSGVPINHMMVMPVALNFASERALPAGSYKAVVTVRNGTAYLMSYGFRQMIAQLFEE